MTSTPSGDDTAAERSTEARAELKAMSMQEKARAAVAEWPPLTDQQRIELSPSSGAYGPRRRRSAQRL
jgi:hypothetical protein